MDFEERLARAILEAMRIREESFDQEAAAEIGAEERFVNFEKFYRMSYNEAADKAASNVGFDLRMSQPIYFLIKYVWNDIGAWAEKLVGKIY